MIDKYTLNLFKKILRIASKKNIKIYLVGGYLRDLILKNRKRKDLDIDFCLKKGAIDLGKRVASRLKAGFVILDKKHRCCRVVKKINTKTYTLDFTDFRGRDLKTDLFKRDFTINAFAIDLEDFLKKRKDFESLIIDPYGGKKDLKKGIVRLVNEKGFLDDPLRILRAFSIAGLLDFKIDKKTFFLIKKYSGLIAKVSGERIRDELFKILDLDYSYNYLKKMDEEKVLEVIFPQIKSMRNLYQGPYHHLDVFQHSLETIRQLEFLLKELKDSDLKTYLDENLCGNRRRYSLIKLAAFLHDIGKPKAKRFEEGKIKFHGHERIGLEITEEIAKNLKLSNIEIESLKKIVLWHLRPGYLADLENLTARAKFRFFRDTGEDAVSVLLVSLADQRATRGPLTTLKDRKQHEEIVKSLIKEYFKKKKEKPFKRLLTGYDLINKFKLEPSPLFGKILKEVEELQAIGKIKTKREALAWVGKFIKSY